MSMTKALRKSIKTMTDDQIRGHAAFLAREKTIERNPMIRSSIVERIAICETELNRRAAQATAISAEIPLGWRR